MINLKTREEIEIMKQGGKILQKTIAKVLPLVKPGVTTSYLDKTAESILKEYGGEPSFRSVSGYQWTLCTPINEQAVHTPPSNRALREGELVTIDIGVLYRGYHTDYATSLVVGTVHKPKLEAFLQTGRQALAKGIAQARVNNHLGHISQAIEKEIYAKHFFVLKDLTGHGIGRQLHEDPFVFNYLDRPIEKTERICEGLVIAIEVIYSMGSEEIVYEKRGEWSIKTSDSGLSACFEHTVAIIGDKGYILA